MAKYTSPELELLAISTEDVILASGGNGFGTDDNGGVTTPEDGFEE